MTEFVDLLLTFLTVGLGALGGSAFMWLVLGPLVLRRAAPKLIRGVLQEVANVSDAEISAADGDLFKAMTKKQGDTFAQAIYGAMGNIVQAAPTGELEKLAQQYGFEGVEDAKTKILGGGPGAGIPAGIAPNLLQTLGGVNGGKKNAFSGIVDLIVGLNALSGLGGSGGMPALQSMGGFGGSSPSQSSIRVSGW
jgi:hypothetical protein